MNFLILIGVAALAVSLVPAAQILRSTERDTGSRKYWYILITLTCFFMAVYLVYFTLDLRGLQKATVSIIPVILVSGALFVLVVTLFSARTISSLKRIAVLEQENITDSLTKIYNRRYYDQRITEEFTRSRRYRLPLSITILDMDCFKVLNDTYGHDFGDHVLLMVGKIIHESIRDIDVPARFGGDEFILIHPSTGLSGARMVSQRLQESISSTDFSVSFSGVVERPVRCTMSTGTAELTEEMENPRELLNAADAALYESKRV